MSASITINNQSNTITNHSTDKLQSPGIEGLFSSVLQGVNSSKEPVINNVNFSNKISHIDASEVKDIYQKIRSEANEDLDEASDKSQGLTIFDYLSEAVDRIMDYSLDVKIEWKEVNTAILYNRMGINFLDIKRIEVRMELLALARQELEENKASMSAEKRQKLAEKIDNNLSELANRKQSILDGSEVKKQGQLFLEKLMFSQ